MRSQCKSNQEIICAEICSQNFSNQILQLRINLSGVPFFLIITYFWNTKKCSFLEGHKKLIEIFFTFSNSNSYQITKQKKDHEYWVWQLKVGQTSSDWIYSHQFLICNLRTCLPILIFHFNSHKIIKIPSGGGLGITYVIYITDVKTLASAGS